MFTLLWNSLWSSSNFQAVLFQSQSLNIQLKDCYKQGEMATYMYIYSLSRAPFSFPLAFSVQFGSKCINFMSIKIYMACIMHILCSQIVAIGFWMDVYKSLVQSMIRWLTLYHRIFHWKYDKIISSLFPIPTTNNDPLPVLPTPASPSPKDLVQNINDVIIWSFFLKRKKITCVCNDAWRYNSWDP